MINDEQIRIFDRYRYMHAKHMLVDRELDPLHHVDLPAWSATGSDYDPTGGEVLLGESCAFAW